MFLAHEEEILAGTFSHALLDKSKYKAQMDDIIAISIDKVYRSDEVLQKEIVGYKVISTLLSAFCKAAVNKLHHSTSPYDELILRLIPQGTPMVEESLYKTVLNASCFVASLSDGKAMELAKKMN